MSTRRFVTESRLYRHLAMEVMEDRVVLSANPFGQIDIVTIEQMTDASHDTVLASAAAASGMELETLALLVPTTGNNTYNQMTGLNDVKNLYGLDGSGQTVVVIDSGIAYNHIDLGGGFGEGYRVVGGYDFANRDYDPYDSGPFGAHGTHVAGIIASSGSQFPGVATGVDLVALKIFNDDGSSNMQYLIDALQWVHENKNTFANPITTINLSVGFLIDSNGYYHQINEWFRILNDDGIFISVAAGNSFDSMTEKSWLSYPAMSEYVVSVGSVGISGEVSYFSQRSENTIMAPGQYVKSTVPDYVGNRNGIDDDYSTFSGTSMAAPYVAGASTLIRQAMQIVGMTDITQQMIYDVIVATADKIYDAVTGQYFSRINIKSAIESILPPDTFGNSIADATGLGTVVDTIDIDGFFNTKTDKDFFSFVAGKDGTIVITPEMSVGLTGAWDISAVPGAIVAADGTVTLDVTAGKTYTLGLNATGKIGMYSLHAQYVGSATDPGGDTDTGGTTEPGGDTDTDDKTDPEFPVNPDIPGSDSIAVTVDQATLDNQLLTESGKWYAVTASNTGTMTFEILLPAGVSRQTVVIEIGDASGNVTTTSTGQSRVDFNMTAGTTAWVRVSTASGTGSLDDATIRLTNLVRQAGSQVFVIGTDRDDVISLAAGITHQLIVNGVQYAFDAGTVTNINIDGRGGNDTIRYIGSGSDETITIDGTVATIAGKGYTVGVQNAEYLDLDANGGNNTFRYYDTPGDDLVTVRTGEITIASSGFFARVNGATKFFAFAERGGNDSAILYDSSGDDTLTVSATYTLFNSGGTTSQLYSFKSLVAYSVNGGSDTATVTDTSGETLFTGSWESMKRFSANQYVEVRGFVQVNLTNMFGGNNTVRLEDSIGNDTLYVTANGVSLNGANYGISVRGFDYVHTSAVNGGNNKIMIYDTHKANMIIAAKSMISVIDSLHRYEADGFGEIWAFGSNRETSQIENNGTDYMLYLLGLWEDALATSLD